MLNLKMVCHFPDYFSTPDLTSVTSKAVAPPLKFFYVVLRGRVTRLKNYWLSIVPIIPLSAIYTYPIARNLVELLYTQGCKRVGIDV